MYATYFGLREQPFNATPDTRYCYAHPAYREAYAALLCGIRERKGFITLTGEVGTGKTTLLRRLMDNVDPATKVVFLYNTTLEFDELVEFICGELQIPVSGLSGVARLQALNRFLLEEDEQGGTVVLLLDEAQNLSAATLESLRLLSNPETGTARLLQIVLAGQPELEWKLGDPALRLVFECITVRHRLKQLGDSEVEPFIDHRLRVMGRQRWELFTDDAIRKLIPYVKGLPRLINIVCDNALLAAYGLDAQRVTGQIIEAVVADLRLKPPGQRQAPASDVAASMADETRWRWVGVASAAVVGIALVGGVFWSQPEPGSPADRRLARNREISRPTRTTVQVGSEQVAPVLGPLVTPTHDRPASAVRARVVTAALPMKNAGRYPAEPKSAPAAQIAGGRIVTMPPGGTISEIARRHYGRYSGLALDLIQESNPAIRDIDVVPVGQRLRLPPLTFDAMLRRQADGSYRVLVGSQPAAQAADLVEKSVRKHGYEVLVTPRKVGSRHVLLRVEIDRLTTRVEAMRAWKTARSLGWLE